MSINCSMCKAKKPRNEKQWKAVHSAYPLIVLLFGYLFSLIQ